MTSNQTTYILDGKMTELIPFLPGWFFLNLYERSKTARSVFISVEDVLTEFEESTESKAQILNEILEANQAMISAFLGQFMANQVNCENVIGYRWDEERIASYLAKMTESVNSDENIDVSDLTSNSYFAAKWSGHLASHARSIMLIENLSAHLSSNLIQTLLKKLNLSPIDDSEIKKRLKSAETIIKQIPSGSSLKNADSIAPTEDYSNFNGKKTKQSSSSAASREKGQSSIAAFFKK